MMLLLNHDHYYYYHYYAYHHHYYYPHHDRTTTTAYFKRRLLIAEVKIATDMGKCIFTYVSHGAHEFGAKGLDQVIQVRAGARHADNQCVIVHVWVFIQ